eukprot:363042-Chlamydomonas_euryale.AAC.9
MATGSAAALRERDSTLVQATDGIAGVQMTGMPRPARDIWSLGARGSFHSRWTAASAISLFRLPGVRHTHTYTHTHTHTRKHTSKVLAFKQRADQVAFRARVGNKGESRGGGGGHVNAAFRAQVPLAPRPPPHPGNAPLWSPTARHPPSRAQQRPPPTATSIARLRRRKGGRRKRPTRPRRPLYAAR